MSKKQCHHNEQPLDTYFCVTFIMTFILIDVISGKINDIFYCIAKEFIKKMKVEKHV